MLTASISSISTLVCQDELRPATPAGVKPVQYEPQAKPVRTWLRGCLLLIAFLFDVTCIFWVFPVADQLAEWAGVSLLNAIYVGAAAMLASVPVIVGVTVWGWGYAGRR